MNTMITIDNLLVGGVSDHNSFSDFSGSCQPVPSTRKFSTSNIFGQSLLNARLQDNRIFYLALPCRSQQILVQGNRTQTTEGGLSGIPVIHDI